MKKIFLYIVIGITLLAIPATVFLVGQQQDIRKKAAPATTLALSPATVNTQPGKTFKLNIQITPGTNQITAARLNITFDPAKLEAVAITNGSLAPKVVNSGVIENGTASITVGAASTTRPIKSAGTIAVLTLKAKDSTGATPSVVQFASTTFLSGVGDAATNVLVGSTTAKITVGGTSQTTPTPSVNATPPAVITFGGAAGNTYNPSTLTVVAGTPVTWTGTFKADPLVSVQQVWKKRTSGSSFTFIFAKPGTYTYYSSKHGKKDLTGMSGKVIVTSPTGAIGSTTGDLALGSWDFNENTGTTIGDNAESNSGTWTGTGPHWGTGEEGAAATFNGTDDAISVPNTASISLEYTQPFSIFGWFKTTVTDTKPQIAIEKMSQDATLRGYSLAFVGGKIQVTLQNVGSTTPPNAIIVQTTSTTVSDGAWHYVGFTYDGSGKAAGVKIYKDGTQVTDVQIVSDNLSGTIVNSAPLSFGKRLFDPNKATLFYKGSMDDAQIFNHTRTADQVSADAGADTQNGGTTPTPTSATTATPTPTGGATMPTPTPTGTSGSSSLQILTPANNVSVTSSQPTIQGKAAPGSTVTITVYSSPQTAVVTADANGNWVYTPATPLEPGPHSAVASVTAAGGTTQTTTTAFVVAGAGEAGATESGIPISGNTETTLILIAIAMVFLATGALVPVFTR